MIVVEEGGAVDAADVVRRSNCPLVLDVDITTTRAWTLRRETPVHPPRRLPRRHPRPSSAAPDRAGPGGEPDRGLQPAPVPG